MRNRALALAARPIPYIKELREIAGSITASILMQQLDYWFSSYPEGFYKFLEPCDNAACKESETWTEELGFSPDEFRSAFDKIGIRHESKRAFESAENPFIKTVKTDQGERQQECFYASYHDKIRTLTYYFRNHDLLDKKIDDLLAQRPKKERSRGAKKAASVAGQSPATVARQTQSTEMDFAKLRNPEMPSSVAGQSPATELGKPNLEYKETESTTESTTERERDPRSHPIGKFLLLGAGYSEVQVETLSPLNYSKLQAAITRLSQSQITPAQIQQARQNWWGQNPPTFDQLADEALKVASGNGSPAKHDSRTHYPDGREKPPGIRGLVV